MAPGRVIEHRAHSRDFRGEGRSRGTERTPLGFEARDRLGRLAGEIIAARREGGHGAGFEILRAHLDLRQPARLRGVPGHGRSQHPPAPLQVGSGLANLLIEDEEGVAVVGLLAGLGGGAAGKCSQQRQHGITPRA